MEFRQYCLQRRSMAGMFVQQLLQPLCFGVCQRGGEMHVLVRQVAMDCCGLNMLDAPLCPPTTDVAEWLEEEYLEYIEEKEESPSKRHT